MTINHFAGSQNVVFVPALLLVLLATVAICAPIVLAPGLRRSGRLRPAVIVAGIVAVVALGFGAQRAAAGFGTLGAERAALRAELRTDYGMTFTSDEVGTLVDGGELPRSLPDLQQRLNLREREAAYDLKIEPRETGSDVYDLTFGGVPVPKV